ncbi:hypothetical protein FM020_01790 [Acinetobacter tandoii]|nr:hypothetical protein FM020_01790 [Acinetobacter tandoii]
MVRWSGGQVVRWSGGQVVRWSGGQVVRWSGGQVIASQSKILERYFPLPKGTPRQNHQCGFKSEHRQLHGASIEP